MESRELRDINFRRLIEYADGPPKPTHKYEIRPQVLRYCRSCEDQGLISEGYYLREISHGADSHDFATLAQESLPVGEGASPRVMFAFESPGLDTAYAPRPEDAKVPKIDRRRSYYWMYDSDGWPLTAEEVGYKKDGYGPQLAYFIRKFQLREVYVTNAVKCSLFPMGKGGAVGHGPRKYKTRDDQAVSESMSRCCLDSFFRKEVEAFAPDIIFAFGGTTHGLLKRSGFRERLTRRALWHPAYEKRGGPKLAKIVEHNEEIIADALKRFVYA